VVGLGGAAVAEGCVVAGSVGAAEGSLVGAALGTVVTVAAGLCSSAGAPTVG
jgi:hypothetical protein